MLDSTLFFSDAQAITSTASSTNVIDLTVANNIGPGEPIRINIVAVLDFAAAGAAELVVHLQTSVDEAFTSPINLLQTQVVAVDDLIAGKKILIDFMPSQNERYLRLNYQVNTGPFTAGAIFAAIVNEVQTNK